jgi:hypothetical protein
MTSRRTNLTFKCSSTTATFSHADAGALRQPDTGTNSAGLWQSPKQAPEFTAFFQINLT